MVVKEKIDIDKLSLEELTELYKNCIRDLENCIRVGDMQCSDCSLSTKNYVGGFIGNSCYFVAIRILERIYEIYKLDICKKEIHENSKCQEVNWKCSECSYLNKELLDNGYCFCYHWHNFTKPDGFCSFGEREKRPVDNSEISCETNT